LPKIVLIFDLVPTKQNLKLFNNLGLYLQAQGRNETALPLCFHFNVFSHGKHKKERNENVPFYGLRILQVFTLKMSLVGVFLSTWLLHLRIPAATVA